VSEIKKHFFKPPKNIKNLSDADLEKWAEEIIDTLIQNNQETKKEQ
jgi:hypothetical protein